MSATRTVPRPRREPASLATVRALPITIDRLRGVVDELASLGSRPDGFRVTGTGEDRRAAELVGERMRAIGLRDVALEPVCVDGWRLGACTLELEGRTIHGASFGGAPGTPPEGVTAPLVDAGRGERRRLDRLELAGRIALLDWHSLGLAPAEVALELMHRGVRAIVLASFAGGPLYQDPGAVGSFDAHWYPDAPPVLTVAKEDAAELRASLRRSERTGTVRIDAELTRDAPGHNVVGYLPGREPGPPIVIGAHHDAWFHGAFDNASGVAILLALAEAMTQLGHEPRHTLCFTSRTAEEYGLAFAPFDWCAGAWQQVSAQHAEWGEAPFHLCLEASGHPGLRTIVETTPELAGWARSVCRAADAEGWLTAGWRLGPPVTGTEQWPYLVAGVPGVAAYSWETSFRRTSYHTPADTAALIDFDHLARLARFDALLLLEADADPDAVHDHRARARHLAKAAVALGERGEPLRAAAERHARRRGRRAFTPVGRGLYAVDAHGAAGYPYVQSAADLARLEEGIGALGRDDVPAAIAALERVGTNRLTRVQSHASFAAHLARRDPGAPRLAWAAASHLTATADLSDELAALRGEAGSRPSGDWLSTSLERHRADCARELTLRVADMARVLQTDPPETP